MGEKPTFDGRDPGAEARENAIIEGTAVRLDMQDTTGTIHLSAYPSDVLEACGVEEQRWALFVVSFVGLNAMREMGIDMEMPGHAVINLNREALTKLRDRIDHELNAA